MNRKKIALFIIIFGLLLLVAIIVYFFYFSAHKPQSLSSWQQLTSGHLPASRQSQSQAHSVNKNSSGQAKIDLSQPPKPVQKIDQEALARLAASFAERFGSFSNQANFNNVKDLEILMTDKMYSWSQDYIKNLQTQEQTSEFYAITTKAINSQTIDYQPSNGQAKVKVVTQRREIKGQDQPHIFYQDIVLFWQKQNNQWKVDRIEWDKNKREAVK